VQALCGYARKATRGAYFCRKIFDSGQGSTLLKRFDAELSPRFPAGRVGEMGPSSINLLWSKLIELIFCGDSGLGGWPDVGSGF